MPTAPALWIIPVTVRRSGVMIHPVAITMKVWKEGKVIRELKLVKRSENDDTTVTFHLRSDNSFHHEFVIGIGGFLL